ncbi:MAG: DNA polymerase IV [Acidimicrobiales bacterium]
MSEVGHVLPSEVGHVLPSAAGISDAALTGSACTDSALTDSALTDSALTDSALTDSAHKVDATRTPGVDATGAPGVEECTVLHVDMDAFFASVEVLDHPELAGKPVIVGGSGNRGVVASCTYEARAFGVRSAMSSVEARRRCPQAVFMPGRYWRYAETSERFHTVLKEFTPLVEGIGLDEAFLDVRGAVRLLGPPPHIASSIRQRVREELEMDCSVGVARTKLLAKLGSRQAKPRASLTGALAGSGVCVITPSEEIPFLHALPIRALWGVGPATARRLESLGVSTVGALAEVPETTLCRLLGSANGRHLAALARGEDERTVQADRGVKSISHEETFAKDVMDRGELRRHVLRMSDAVGARLAESALWGRTVSVKVRFADRQTITRSHTAAGPLRASHAVSTVAQALIDAVGLSQGVRLVGVSVSGLDRADKQDARQLSFDALELDGPSAPTHTPGVPGDAYPGDVRSGQAHSGQTYSGQAYSGQTYSGQAHSGQAYAGQAYAGRSLSGQAVSAQALSAEVDDEAWLNVQEALSAIRARYGQGSVGPAALVGPGGLEAKGRGDTHWGPEADASTDNPTNTPSSPERSRRPGPSGARKGASG